MSFPRYPDIQVQEQRRDPVIPVPTVRTRWNVYPPHEPLTVAKAQRAHETVSRLKVRFAVALESMTIIPKGLGSFALVGFMLVPDRDTGEIREAQFEHVFTPEAEALDDPERFAMVVRIALRQAVLHEIDESIRVDGALVFDPHK